MSGGGMLETMAGVLLPLLDDPQSFDGPLPICTADAHQWAIVHDKTVPWQDRYASGETTYPVAIACSHCDFIAGFG